MRLYAAIMKTFPAYDLEKLVLLPENTLSLLAEMVAVSIDGDKPLIYEDVKDEQ